MPEYAWNNVQKYTARTTDVVATYSADGAKGVRVSLDITALAATQSLTVHIQSRDPATGKFITLLSSAAVAAATAAQTTYIDGQPTVLTVYPDMAAVANVAAGTHIGDDLRIVVDSSGAGPHTFTLGIQFLH